MIGWRRKANIVAKCGFLTPTRLQQSSQQVGNRRPAQQANLLRVEVVVLCWVTCVVWFFVTRVDFDLSHHVFTSTVFEINFTFIVFVVNLTLATLFIVCLYRHLHTPHSLRHRLRHLRSLRCQLIPYISSPVQIVHPLNKDEYYRKLCSILQISYLIDNVISPSYNVYKCIFCSRETSEREVKIQISLKIQWIAKHSVSTWLLYTQAFKSKTLSNTYTILILA